MKTLPLLTFKPVTRTGGDVLLTGKRVAEIRNLQLQNLRMKTEADPILGHESGLPLYWRQYAGNEDPEKSARYHGGIDVLEQSTTRLRLHIRGTTKSGNVRSDFQVTFSTRSPAGAMEIRVTAKLTIPEGRTWQITPNPDHGEVTFCTLWPSGVFSPDGSKPKRYQWCLIKSKSGTSLRIPHHHLESRDKHNHRMMPGDRFYWITESQNPVFELLAGQNVEAGLCAYMWDAHFGLRLGHANQPIDLVGPFQQSVSFRLKTVPRTTAVRMQRSSRMRPLGAMADTPIYHDGRHSFDRSFRNTRRLISEVWPWQTCVVAGNPAKLSFFRDDTFGHGDHHSLRITQDEPAHGCWEATTLGPAYGEPPFPDGGRLKLTAMVRTKGVTGAVWIAIRLHRRDRGSVYELANYENFESPRIRRSEVSWQHLEVITPSIQPGPDRVHLLLQFKGRGSAWFDDVELIRLPRRKVRP